MKTANVDMMTEVVQIIAMRDGIEEAENVTLGAYLGVFSARHNMTQAQAEHCYQAVADIAKHCATASQELREASGQ